MVGALILLIIVAVLFLWGALVYHGVITRTPKPKTALDYPIDRKLWRKAEENAEIARRFGVKNCSTEFYYTDLWNQLHNKK